MERDGKIDEEREREKERVGYKYFVEVHKAILNPTFNLKVSRE